VLVSELIDILRDQPGDAEIEIAVVAPVGDDDGDITVDRYPLEGVYPWSEADPDSPDADPTSIWLICGDDDDVDEFIDALEGAVGTPDFEDVTLDSRD
jgi:hypothetical protein